MEGGEWVLDASEPFRKMTNRNRYAVTGSNNAILLSIPLVDGRNQRIPMNEVKICNEEKWQVQHIRTLTSVYKRTPYFDYYERSLIDLFESPFELLTDFNFASIRWIARQLKIKPDFRTTTQFHNDQYRDLTDLRIDFFKKPEEGSFPEYVQIFSERNGFQPNISILDLLFSEGPATVAWLHQHKDAILLCCQKPTTI